jgi:hypothetical protein
MSATSGSDRDRRDARERERLRRRAAFLAEIEETRRLRGRLVERHARLARVRDALYSRRRGPA